jgi:antitoxin ParD1/3/4
MATMNISLPTPLKEFVDSRVAGGGFGGSSDYVRDLIRKDMDVAALRELLLAGASSPASKPVDERYFQDLTERAQRRRR